MHERIKTLRKHLKLTQQEFADRIGIKQNTLSQYESGRNVPIDAVIALICREFEISEAWLRTGEGEMKPIISRDQELSAFLGRVLSDRPDSIRRRLIYALSRLDESGWEVVDQMATLIAAEKKEEPED